MTAGAQRPGPKVGRVARLKLTQPVRLYVYGFQLLAGIVVLAAAAFNSGPALMFAVPCVLMFWFSAVLGAEAANKASYSPRDVVQAVMQARQQ